MTPFIIGLVGISSLLLLIALRCPIGLAMGIVGFSGFAYLVGFRPALSLLETGPYEVASNYSFTIIPLFMLMGNLAARANISRDLFEASYALTKRWRGGLALAAITTSAGFSAVSGSSLATAATVARVSLPEMTKLGYDQGLSTGSLAAGGTLGIMIPPSIALLLYALITEQSVTTMFLAGVLPGILAYSIYLLTIVILVWRRPGLVENGDGQNDLPSMSVWEALRKLAPVLGLFIFVIGGLYVRLFTPTEAAGVGAFATLVLAYLRGGLGDGAFFGALKETLETSISLFIIIIGAEIFGFFLSASELTFSIVSYMESLSASPMTVLMIILVFYIVMGCFLESLAMILLTVPIFYPVIIAAGFDPVWFGIIAVVTVELGLITPPVGMNIFVIKSIAPEIPVGVIMKGVLPFVVADIFRLAILVLVPAITLFLPQYFGF